MSSLPLRSPDRSLPVNALSGFEVGEVTRDFVQVVLKVWPPCFSEDFVGLVEVVYYRSGLAGGLMF